MKHSVKLRDPLADEIWAASALNNPDLYSECSSLTFLGMYWCEGRKKKLNREDVYAF